MWWFLFESDDGWCVVMEKNIIQAGTGIEVGDQCRFYYQGKEYTGKVLMKDEDHDKISRELSDMKKRQTKNTKSIDTVLTRGKRKINPTTFYGLTAPTGEQPSKKGKANCPKVTEEEKAKQRILKLNKEEAARRANSILMSKTGCGGDKNKGDSDLEWDPAEDPFDKDGSSSDSSQISDLVEHGKQVKEKRTNLMKSLKNPATSTPTQEKSPTKEELKRQNEILQIKLQMAYDEANASTAAVPKKNPREQPPRISEDKEAENEHLNTSGGLQSEEQDSEMGGLSKESRDDSGLGNNQVDSPGDNIDQEEEVTFDVNQSLEYQLYGKRNDTTLLCKGIYCKTDVVTKGLSNAKDVPTTVRRLMHGVFIPSKVQDCTVSGRSWHAGGQEKLKEKMKPLHPGALRAIVDFANGVGKTKKWPLKKFDKLRSTFSVRLNEIKNQFKAGKLED